MNNINYVIGDATEPQGDGLKIIVHCCNDVGGWGAGFVMAISDKWKKPEKDYRKWYHDTMNDSLPADCLTPLRLGEIQYVPVDNDLWVANLIGQRGTHTNKNGRSPIRYDAINQGLEKIVSLKKFTGADFSVHMPRMGAGLAGGRWEVIEALINITLIEAEIPVTVYDFTP
jgi:O-acetyl-ADP-ribose deacetylase (regulator of RNase III)